MTSTNFIYGYMHMARLVFILQRRIFQDELFYIFAANFKYSKKILFMLFREWKCKEYFLYDWAWYKEHVSCDV